MPRASVTHHEALDGLFAAWRSGDALRSVAYFALDGVYREAKREPIAGREAIVAHFTRFFRDGPLWEFTADEVIVEDNAAAVRYRFSMTPLDGTRVQHAGCAFVTFRDGTIAEWREYEG